MSSSRDNGKFNGLWKWVARNDFRALRFIFAIILFFSVVMPLAKEGKGLFTREYNELIQKTKTITEPSVQTTKQEADSNIKEDREKPIIPSETVAVRTETEVVSASPRVWVYGLQLAAWIGALGISLWALVSLCRDE
jgi:hypothetical protein